MVTPTLPVTSIPITYVSGCLNSKIYETAYSCLSAKKLVLQMFLFPPPGRHPKNVRIVRYSLNSTIKVIGAALLQIIKILAKCIGSSRSAQLCRYSAVGNLFISERLVSNFVGTVIRYNSARGRP